MAVDDDEFGAGVVAVVKFGVEGAGEGLGVVRDYTHASPRAAERHARVRDHVHARRGDRKFFEGSREIVFIAPREHDESGAR